MSRALLCGVVFALICMSAAEQNNGSQSVSVESACASPRQKEFDFWVGSWDLTWPGEKPGEVAHGTNQIRRVLDSCIVQENFDGTDSMHLRGMSVSVFDTRAGKWKQTWVDNEGGYLDFIGEFKNGEMILSRQATRPDGTKILQRMVWKNLRPDEFDWSWESSKDDGNSWQVLWPIHYKRHATTVIPGGK